jgi:hypothetical protein
LSGLKCDLKHWIAPSASLKFNGRARAFFV